MLAWMIRRTVHDKSSFSDRPGREQTGKVPIPADNLDGFLELFPGTLRPARKPLVAQHCSSLLIPHDSRRRAACVVERDNRDRTVQPPHLPQDADSMIRGGS